MRLIHLLALFSLFAFAALFVLLSPPAPLHAQSGATVTVLAGRLNIRSGPGTAYAVLASAVSGEKYSVVGQTGRCAWLQVAKGGKTLGWLSGSSSYVTLTSPCSAIPAAAAAPAPAPAPGADTAAASQGCALLVNKLPADVKLSVKRSGDGWLSSWSIPAGGQSTVCVAPGSYTATFTAASLPGSLAFPVTVKGGESYQIPLSLPGN